MDKSEKKYNVIVIALKGANYRKGLDEKTARLGAFASGAILDGYFLEKSDEDIEHVYVQDPKNPNLAWWIRYRERDSTMPLVAIQEVAPPAEKQIADALNRIAAALEARV